MLEKGFFSFFGGYHIFARSLSCLPPVVEESLEAMADNIVPVPTFLSCIVYKYFCLFFFDNAIVICSLLNQVFIN